MTEKKRCESNRRKRILFHKKIGENRQQRAANPPKNDLFLKRKCLQRKTLVRGAQNEDTGSNKPENAEKTVLKTGSRRKNTDYFKGDRREKCRKK